MAEKVTLFFTYVWVNFPGCVGRVIRKESVLFGVTDATQGTQPCVPVHRLQRIDSTGWVDRWIDEWIDEQSNRHD